MKGVLTGRTVGGELIVPGGQTRGVLTERLAYAAGTTTTQETLRKDVFRELVMAEAETMMVGLDSIESKNLGVLDMQLDIPNQTAIAPTKQYEGTRGKSGRITTFPFRVSMQKWENGFDITAEAKIRQSENIQIDMGITACAQGLAEERDSEIFTTLAAGAGNTVDAVDQWDQSTTAKPEDDIANAIGKIMSTTKLNERDIQNIVVNYPAEMWAQLAKPIEVNGIMKTLRNWAESEFMISFRPSRELTDDAIVVVKGVNTAMQLNYNGTGIMMSEEINTLSGDEFNYLDFFQTAVVPESATVSTNKRICTITDCGNAA